MKGFSLIEILLSIALMTLIFGLGVSVFIVMSNKNENQVAVNYFKNSLYQAQLKSVSIEEDDSWGVSVQNGLITVFKGSSFVSRDQSFDNNFEISEKIIISGEDEYVFSKNEGMLSGNYSTTFSYNNDDIILNVNKYGVVN